MTTLVTIGNSKFRFSRLLDVIDSLAPEWPQPVIVQHGHTPFSGTHCVARAFLEREEFDRLVADSKLVITHGGATVFQAVRSGKLPVVVPRKASLSEHIDDHQVEFCTGLANIGQALLVLDVRDIAVAVRRSLETQRERAEGGETAMVGLVRDALLRFEYN